MLLAFRVFAIFPIACRALDDSPRLQREISFGRVVVMESAPFQECQNRVVELARGLDHRKMAYVRQDGHR